jgi:predicted nuclease of predicted toxin-antitoxin system
MNFLVDECCDTALVNVLRTNGHDVVYVLENLKGATDDEVLEHAHSENRILITEDKDFGELVYRLRRSADGIILLRFDVIERSQKIPRLLDLIQNEGDRLAGSFVSLDVDKIRIRPLLR